MKDIKINIVVGGRFHSGQIYTAMKENGLDTPSLSFKQLANPFFAKEVFPTPGGPSNPKQ